MQGFAIHQASNGYIPPRLDTFPKSYAEAFERFASWRDNPKRRSDECKLAGNTFLLDSDRWGKEAYSIKYHGTRVVTFYADGSIVLDSNGWQTFTTRDRINRAGLRIGMAGGIASVRYGGFDWTYADGMRLEVIPGEGQASVTYPPELRVQSNADGARKARRRALARERRAIAKGAAYIPYAWRWDNRAGGRAHGGNAPEAFGEDS